MVSTPSGETRTRTGTIAVTKVEREPRQSLWLGVPAALLLLSGLHCLVDAYAALVQPLWPDLERVIVPAGGSITVSYTVWSLATSVSQLGFGYWADRTGKRGLIWIGALLGVPCMSAVGLVESPWLLNGLLIVGGLGTAAFHPEAAALAGSSMPGHRARAMSVFAVGGFLGQAIGPFSSGALTTAHGLPALIWGLPFGILCLAMLASTARWSIPLRVHGEEPPPPITPAGTSRGQHRLTFGEMVRGQETHLLFLLLVGILRALPATGTPVALAYAIKAQGGTNEEIGWLQSMFLGGIGLGGLGCAMLGGRLREKTMLAHVPWLVVPVLLALPRLESGSWAQALIVGTAGFLLGAVGPVMVGYGQRLLPRGQRVASSITMGVTYGLAGVIVAGLLAGFQRAGCPERVFDLFAVTVALSCLLCARLREPAESSSDAPLDPAPPSS